MLTDDIIIGLVAVVVFIGSLSVALSVASKILRVLFVLACIALAAYAVLRLVPDFG